MSSNRSSLQQVTELCLTGSRLEEAIVRATSENVDEPCDSLYLGLLQRTVASKGPDLIVELWSHVWIRFASASPTVSAEQVSPNKGT